MAKPISMLVFGDEGVTSIEYALIASVIALVIVGTLVTLGVDLQATYNKIGGCLASFTPAACS